MSEIEYIRLPELGENITEATLACWHCAQGSTVTKDDDVAEVVTDKATFNITAERQGKVKSLCVSPGETVPVGAILAEIDVQRSMDQQENV